MKEIPGPDLPVFERLTAIIEALRSPGGCPWDREQTPQSLRAALIEETYETVDAINKGDSLHVREELGDVIMLAAMIGRIYEENGEFTLEDALRDASEKLIRRHPHVFGDAVAETPEAVAKQWKSIKEHVEGRKKDSILDEVNQSLPPLERAFKIQKKAAKKGFDWASVDGIWDKIQEEIDEVREVLALGGEAGEPPSDGPESEASMSGDGFHVRLEDEIGDLLFSVVNLSRYLDVDPSLALQRTVSKFDSRFRQVERRMAESGLEMGPATLPEMEEFWQLAKKR